MYLIETVFDEGITLMGRLLAETNELLHEVYQAIVHTLYKELQAKPESFALRIDSEAAKAMRNISPRCDAMHRDQAARGESLE